MDLSGALPKPTGGEEDDPDSDKPKTVPPKIGNLPPEFKPSARDAWAQGFQDALKELEQEAIWKTKKGLFSTKKIRNNKILYQIINRTDPQNCQNQQEFKLLLMIGSNNRWVLLEHSSFMNSTQGQFLVFSKILRNDYVICF